MEEKGLTVADALALRNSGDDGFGFGNGGGWWVIILILFLMSGFGRGFGGYGNGNGNGTDTNTIFVPYGGAGFGNGYNNWGPCCSPATAQGISDAFNFNALDNGIRATHEAVTDGFYTNNLATTNLGTAVQQSFGQVQLQNCQGFNSVINATNSGVNSLNAAFNAGINNLNTGMTAGFNNLNTNVTGSTNSLQNSLCNGFNGVQTAIANTNCKLQDCCCENREALMQTNFANQTGFNTLGTAIATNACDIERGQDDIRYIMAQNQNQTMIGIDRLGDRLIDYMNQNKLDELRTELQNAKFQISQAEQTDAIINQLQPIAKPSWLVNSPYQSLNYNGVNACGCGNF